MTDINYAPILTRLEGGDSSQFCEDRTAIMALLGYETREHGRLGQACRLVGSRDALQSLPRMDSADNFEMWVIGKYAGFEINDLGQHADGSWYCGVEHPQFGNDFGYGRHMGTAMWAAFVALAGQVDREAGL